MTESYILSQPWGGLGDSLQFSTIPELCYLNGIDFYVSDKNVYRNPEIKELVWDCNPYVKGVSSLKVNAGDCKYGGGYDPASSIVDLWEHWHGFEMKNHLPIIYYHPQFKKEFQDKILIDFSAISIQSRYHISHIQEFINKIEDKSKYLFIVSKKNKFSYHIIGGLDVYEFNDIFEYADLIYSCRKFLCLHSGGAVLAAAIGRFKSDIDVECFMPQNMVADFTIAMYFFKNIKYRNII